MGGQQQPFLVYSIIVVVAARIIFFHSKCVFATVGFQKSKSFFIINGKKPRQCILSSCIIESNEPSSFFREEMSLMMRDLHQSHDDGE